MKRLPIEKIQKILIIRPDAIGDMVLTLPAIKAIKTVYPNKHITVLASRYNARIIEHLPYIDDILYDRPVQNWHDFRHYVKNLKNGSYDLAIHFYSETKTAWTAFWASIPYHIGDKAKLGLWPIFCKYGLFYKSFDQPKHVVEYNFLLLKPLGITLPPENKIELVPPPDTRVKAKEKLRSLGRRNRLPLIGIQVGVGFGNRPVTPKKYASYIMELRKQQDVDILVTGYTEKEIVACKAIEKQVSSSLIPILDASIQELMGLISECDVFVSVDTGPFHLAAGIGVPQLAIFPSRKVKPLSWAPWRNRHFIVRESHVCPHFCPHEGCPLDICSDALSVSDMVNKTLRLLQGGGYEKPLEQFEYWFTTSMPVLILYDTFTEKAAKRLLSLLREWNFHAWLAPVDSSDLYTILTRHDIAIVHNLSARRRMYLFWLSQKVNAFLHNPPLVIHTTRYPLLKSALIEYYRTCFEKKWI